MKKRYLIKLAPADEKVKISEKGDMELLREIETIAIKSLFYLFAKIKKWINC